MTNVNTTVRKRRRLPGEIAFDRCFMPVVALFVLKLIFVLIELAHEHPNRLPTEAELAAQLPPPAWQGWLFCGVGVVLAFLWVRAVVSLVRAWSDPSARVLRFVAVVLLVPFGIATCRYLLAPFA